MVFGNGIKNIQAAAYNGARTVLISDFKKALALLQKANAQLKNRRKII